ncbi:hypothetical protein SAMN04488505_103497 [Chitinophaga rupis]|uniref:Arm DNA-binding domain-containing protein n=1 Tax=Chitinophaga rupis TaxID=573321 RepID=A0A1H7VZY1_9BACT|nr:Arm DNA-binding domain-containing protein [Chitinophaga rupis]SEM14348.1 hypothetical protein SAMN04488505_103497 [Chitinophaga rupis]
MKENARMSILFWLNGKLSLDKKKTLYVRLTIAGERLELSLGRKVRVDLWDQKSGQLRSDSIDTLQTNQYLV